MTWISEREIAKRIREVRRREGFDGLTQTWQTFASPIPRQGLLAFRSSPVFCAWCDRMLRQRQVASGATCCSKSCAQRMRRAGLRAS